MTKRYVGILDPETGLVTPKKVPPEIFLAQIHDGEFECKELGNVLIARRVAEALGIPEYLDRTFGEDSKVVYALVLAIAVNPLYSSDYTGYASKYYLDDIIGKGDLTARDIDRALGDFHTRLSSVYSGTRERTERLIFMLGGASGHGGPADAGSYNAQAGAVSGRTMFVVTDSEGDLRNIAREAPGSRVFCRILTEGSETADWPLSRKFGCHPDMAIDLILLAREIGLKPCGVSFHVGSQQRDIGTWDSAIAKVRYIFDYLEGEGLKLNLINMGGGFPANYISKTNEMTVYSEEITRYLEEDFGEDAPEIILEPGRSLVAESGVLVSEVVLISQKSSMGVDKWLYLDTGKFNGLIETWDESIKYPLYCEARGEPCEDFIIAGPTCDSQDVMYEYFRNPLPAYIKAGDRVYWLTTGAYTSSYCSVEFNGFPPLPVYFVK